MIGENIKRLRKSRGMTQQMMAEKMHVNQNTISSWERNRTEPNMGMIEAMAEVLGCSKSDIVGEQYYINPKTAQMALKIQQSRELSAFFDAAQDASPEDLRAAKAVSTFVSTLAKKVDTKCEKVDTKKDPRKCRRTNVIPHFQGFSYTAGGGNRTQCRYAVF